MKQATPHDAARELLLRREGRNSLLTFTQHTHHDYRAGEHHKTICDALERVERGEIDRLMIFAPPRYGKSELVSVRFPAWYLGRNTNKQIICTSYNDDLASDFGRKVRGVIQSEGYKRFFGDLSLTKDASAANRWHTTNGGIYVSVGIGGTLSGRGGDIVLIDDPTRNAEDASSKRMRDRLWNIYNSDILSRTMPGAAVILMHTRWHPDDLAGRLLERMEAGDGDKWHIIKLPALLNEGTDDEQALWPEAFPLEQVRRRKKNIDRKTWVSLYQQEPQPDGGEHYQRDWFEFYRPSEAPARTHKYIASDLALTPESYGDFTEHSVWGFDSNNDLWALDWWYGKESPEAWIEIWINLMEQYNPLRVFAESGTIRRATEGSIEKRMRERNCHHRIEWVNSVSDKRARSTAFRARAAMGKVHFPDNDWGHRVVDQLVGFPGKYDDAVDACSMIGQNISTLIAMGKEEKDKKPVDPWDRAFARHADVYNWKVA